MGKGDEENALEQLIEQVVLSVQSYVCALKSFQNQRKVGSVSLSGALNKMFTASAHAVELRDDVTAAQAKSLFETIAQRCVARRGILSVQLSAILPVELATRRLNGDGTDFVNKTLFKFALFAALRCASQISVIDSALADDLVRASPYIKVCADGLSYDSAVESLSSVRGWRHVVHIALRDTALARIGLNALSALVQGDVSNDRVGGFFEAIITATYPVLS